jgi:hypothetical protein
MKRNMSFSNPVSGFRMRAVLTKSFRQYERLDIWQQEGRILGWEWRVTAESMGLFTVISWSTERSSSTSEGEQRPRPHQ